MTYTIILSSYPREKFIHSPNIKSLNINPHFMRLLTNFSPSVYPHIMPYHLHFLSYLHGAPITHHCVLKFHRFHTKDTSILCFAPPNGSTTFLDRDNQPNPCIWIFTAQRCHAFHVLPTRSIYPPGFSYPQGVFQQSQLHFKSITEYHNSSIMTFSLISNWSKIILPQKQHNREESELFL